MVVMLICVMYEPSESFHMRKTIPPVSRATGSDRCYGNRARFVPFFMGASYGGEKHNALALLTNVAIKINILHVRSWETNAFCRHILHILSSEADR